MSINKIVKTKQMRFSLAEVPKEKLNEFLPILEEAYTNIKGTYPELKCTGKNDPESGQITPETLCFIFHGVIISPVFVRGVNSSFVPQYECEIFDGDGSIIRYSLRDTVSEIKRILFPEESKKPFMFSCMQKNEDFIPQEWRNDDLSLLGVNP